jgi:cell wall-associated NlpC family hydrolase
LIATAACAGGLAATAGTASASVPAKQAVNTTQSSTASHGTAHTAKSIGQRIVDKAAAEKGKPYAYGATGPNSFDCSGLTQYVYKQVGVKLPRSSQAQSDAVKHVSNSSKKPGDLLFFGGSNVHHVAIYAGGNKMWTAPDTGDVVKLQNIYTSDYTVGRAS